MTSVLSAPASGAPARARFLALRLALRDILAGGLPGAKTDLTRTSSGVTRTSAASGGSWWSPTGTAHAGSDPMTWTPRPSRWTEPAAGPPTTLISTTPPGSVRSVDPAARWSSVTRSPSRSAATMVASGSSRLPSTHSEGASRPRGRACPPRP